ncbi:PREDICTED: protein TPX2-like isoform X2 [Ipomoea nil]|uniref:protein TPX2-like isoform X2 n=1 Tax=Ipomoea nil TaxID=35883 RepID=UPI00090163EF|nr:PREDICTED: protein TPX2-like isoform X2 [Ipomoea nil]
MEEEMEDMVEYTFTVIEIDLDYEFDAPRYFDFSCEESPADSRSAESWFESAGTYPPSPFVRKLIMSEEMWSENINISPKPKDVDSMSLSESGSDIEVEQDAFATEASNSGNDTEVAPNFYNNNAQKFQNQPQLLPSGLTFYNHIVKDNSKAKNKSAGKPSYPRTSTLMKPTASHLAKQNPSHLVGGSRFLNSVLEKNETNTTISETQANKRQKLEGGLLRKVADAKPQTNFLHKAPKRDGTAVGNYLLAKPRITIPREPDLETALRAQKQRPKPQKEAENGTSVVYRFKARPLNRKIFEGPSLLPKRSTPQLPQFQEFHLKTSERAMQHNSTVLTSNIDKVLQNSNYSSTVECRNIESRRPNIVDPPKQDESMPTHNFKALPLNKKILSSRGDMGVFRNIKKEITVPMEFNFHTEKRVHQHNPPIELFNKLSLTSGTKSSAEAHAKPLQPACKPTKKIDGHTFNKIVR